MYKSSLNNIYSERPTWEEGCEKNLKWRILTQLKQINTSFKSKPEQNATYCRLREINMTYQSRVKRTAWQKHTGRKTEPLRGLVCEWIEG